MNNLEGYKQTNEIICPHCQHVQEEDIIDYTMDCGDLDGEFPVVCENDSCEKEFKIHFIYIPHIKTEKA